MVLAGVIAAASGAVGLYVSYYADTAAGASIAAVVVAVHIAAVAGLRSHRPHLKARPVTGLETASSTPCVLPPRAAPPGAPTGVEPQPADLHVDVAGVRVHGDPPPATGGPGPNPSRSPDASGASSMPAAASA